MAQLTVQRFAPSGVTLNFAAASGGGDTFKTDGKTSLYVKNGGGSPVTVTVEGQSACNQGSLHNLAVSVGAGSEKVIGPLSQSRYVDNDDQLVHVTYSDVTSVTVAAIVDLTVPKVAMVHPETGGVQAVSEAAFEFHSRKGWERLDIDSGTATRLLGSPVTNVGTLSGADLRRLVQLVKADKARELEQQKKDELQAEARKRGLDDSGNKPDLVDRIAADETSKTSITEPAETGAAQTAGSSSEQPAANSNKRSGGK